MLACHRRNMIGMNNSSIASQGFRDRVAGRYDDATHRLFRDIDRTDFRQHMIPGVDPSHGGNSVQAQPTCLSAEGTTVIV